MLVSSLWNVNIAPQKGINRRLALWTNKCIDIAYRIWVYTYISIGNLKAANCIHKNFAKSQNKNNHWSPHATFKQSTRVFSHLPSSDDLWNSRKGPSEFHTILRFHSLLSFTLFPDSGEPPFSPQLLIKMNSYKTSFHKICTIKNNVQKDQEIREAKREERGHADVSTLWRNIALPQPAAQDKGCVGVLFASGFQSMKEIRAVRAWTCWRVVTYNQGGF